jgi:hypothetical protein
MPVLMSAHSLELSAGTGNCAAFTIPGGEAIVLRTSRRDR